MFLFIQQLIERRTRRKKPHHHLRFARWSFAGRDYISAALTPAKLGRCDKLLTLPTFCTSPALLGRGTARVSACVSRCARDVVVGYLVLVQQLRKMCAYPSAKAERNK